MNPARIDQNRIFNPNQFWIWNFGQFGFIRIENSI